MATATSSADDLVGDAIPTSPVQPVFEKVDMSSPWYRPAKQYLRRRQWNQDILVLLNRLPDPNGSVRTIRYVGLPGQHYLDLLSMARICRAKNVRITYMGFRTGDGNDPMPEHPSELAVLSNQTHFSQDSITYPDSVASIGTPGSRATQEFDIRAPFDVVNLDVNGGILHGETTPLLRAVKHVLCRQTARTEPWLLFVTTIAKPGDINEAVMESFFSPLVTNFSKNQLFSEKLSEATTRHLSLTVDSCLKEPSRLSQEAFLRFFTLAIGKWLLTNLSENNPRATVVLRSAYCFRNTGRNNPEMLSLAYLVSPATGGADPSGLTTTGCPTADQQYARAAVALVAPSIETMTDLDVVWRQEETVVLQECEELLKTIGVEDEGLEAWRRRHAPPN